MATRIDVAQVGMVLGTLSPAPFDALCDVARPTWFGVDLLGLPPGAWSSQRRWHARSDEFVHVLSGEVTLVTDAGEEVLRAGDPDGHCLQSRGQGEAHDAEIDMIGPADGAYPHRDGTPYPQGARRGRRAT